METWSFRTQVSVFPHPSSARSCYELADSGINTGTHPPRTHRYAVVAVLTASVARHHRLLTLHIHWHVNNLDARTGPVESLARSDFGHVQVLATESRGYQVDSSCFVHSPVVPKSRQGSASQRYPDHFNALVIQQLDSVMTTNSSVLTLCHTSQSDS